MVMGLSGSVVMDPSTTEIIRRTDALILALHQHPVEKRRRITKGLTRRLVRGSGTGLDLVIIDTSTRSEAEASLEHLLASVIDAVRVGLADPILEERVVETVIALVAEMAAEMDGRDRKKLIDGVRWSGW